MKITIENLIANGYKYYPISDVYQKAIYCEKNGIKLYFINITYVDFSDVPNIPMKESWGCKVQYNTHEEEETFDMSLYIYENTEIERIESFYSNVYSKLNCSPYD